MLKVYGYYRSGNNLLIQTLIKNFEFGNLEQTIHSKPELNRFKETFILDDELAAKHNLKESGGQWNHPYAQLGGGHDITSKRNPNGLYIVRNPMDVMLSLYKLRGFEQEFEDWCTVGQLNVWLTHVNSFVNTQKYFYIKYEDLRDNFKPTIEAIQKQFNLERKTDEYTKVEKLVGWQPKKGELEGKSRTTNDFSEEMNKRFKIYTDFYATI